MKYKMNDVFVSPKGITYNYQIIPETFLEYLTLLSTKVKPNEV